MGAAPEEKPKAYILTLSTELLQHVASLGTAETLITLRLTCKTIEAAARDLFAAEYLSRLECFMLDPQRLRRVHKIMSTDHLANRVRSVALSLSAHETSYGPQVVPNRQQSTADAAMQTINEYATEQYNLHQCRLEGMSTESWNLIQGLLGLVASRPQCSVEVDVQSEDAVYNGIAKCRPQLLRELMDVAQSKGCEIVGLIFNDQYPLRAAHFTSAGIYHDIARGLQKLSYDADPKSAAGLSEPWPAQHWYSVEVILGLANGLQELEISIRNRPLEEANEMDEACSKLCGSVFATANLSCIRRLELTGLAMDAKTLHHIIDRCAHQLRNLWLELFVIVGNDDVFSDLLTQLSKVPRLESLGLWHIHRRSKSLVTGEITVAIAEFMQPGATAAELVQNPEIITGFTTSDALDARTFLNLNLGKRTDYYDVPSS